MHPQGHTRLPRYARDKVGVVEMCHGCHMFPDSVATDRGDNPQWLYTVRFTARERPGFLLIHRPSNMRSHPGQVAFPGGKIDETVLERKLTSTAEAQNGTLLQARLSLAQGIVAQAVDADKWG